MTKCYNLWYIFAQTEQEARAICEYENSTGTAYKRKHHPAHYTPWSSADGRENLFIVWTVR
jgi:hypothetical protein